MHYSKPDFVILQDSRLIKTRRRHPFSAQTEKKPASLYTCFIKRALLADVERHVLLHLESEHRRQIVPVAEIEDRLQRPAKVLIVC